MGGGGGLELVIFFQESQSKIRFFLFWEGGWEGGLEEVIFFYKESKSKKKIGGEGAGVGGARVSGFSY